MANGEPYDMNNMNTNYNKLKSSVVMLIMLCDYVKLLEYYILKLLVLF